LKRIINIVNSALIVLIFSTPSFSQSHQSWSYNKVIYEVNVRQYTEEGTFAAFAAHLPRLRDMGVGILWFMPIHPIGEQNRLGSLGSYYAVQDYLDVNQEFGTLEDFKDLVDTAHSMGMYVIIDWVANHTAWDNPLTTTHPDWYTKDSYGNFVPPAGTDWSDVIDLNYSQQKLRDYMIDAMQFWVEQADIDGFRCDAVSMVPLDFWQTAITELKTVNPDLFMLAEDDGEQYQDAGFDMSYSWGYHGFGDGLLNKVYKDINTANDLWNFLGNEQNAYSQNHYRMHFTSNHDENSWYGTVFEQFGAAAEAFAALTSVINGMPLLYSGEEAGLDKRLAFFDKDQIDWQPHPFAAMYKKLFTLKKDNQTLWNGGNGGKLQRIMTNNNYDIFAFVREKENDKIFAVFNLCPNTINITFSGSKHFDRYADALAIDSVAFAKGTSLALAGWKYKIYHKEAAITGIIDENRTPAYLVCQNYPNPFNMSTAIQFNVTDGQKVSLEIYNALGEKVKTLYSGYTAPGTHSFTWDSKNDAGYSVTSGLYFFKLTTGGESRVQKMLLLR